MVLEAGASLPFALRYARWWMSVTLVLADISSLLMAGFLAVGMRIIFEGRWRFDLLEQVIPIMLFCVGVYAFRHLYPGIGLSPVTEFRKLTTTTSAVFLFFMALTFWARNAGNFSRLTLTLTWVFGLILVPLGRTLTKALVDFLSGWGEPVAVIGSGEQAQWLIEFLRKNPYFGWRPTMAVDDFRPGGDNAPGDVVVVWNEKTFSGTDLAILSGIRTAIMLVSEIPNELQQTFVENQQKGFQRVILIPDLKNINSFGVIPRDLGGLLGLEVRHNLLSFSHRAAKRLLDLTLVLASSVVIVPIIGILALLVRLDSRGRAFYGHTRIGRGGQKFTAWKLHTMVPNADQVLQEYLDATPGLRAEWERSFKLKDDPRVTRLGKFLRKYSLDELPQVWNVLKGEMSLVGPRPIVEDEIKFYGDRFDPYTWVRPGITGLWQVSGRNDVSYEERVRLDEYYVRNWSIWQDVYILARTIVVVLQQEGAY